MAPPGILYVTMQPRPELPAEQFHEWYNNEHGPTRLRMPHIFTNGLRYRAIDKKQPSFLASYDITSMPLLETETYTRLRASRSPREADTIAQIDVTRYFWDLIAIRQDRLPMSIEQFTDDWETRWKPSHAKKDTTGSDEEWAYIGEWAVEEPHVFKGMEGEKGLVVKNKAAHHAISAKLPNKIDNTGKTLVVQYEVKLQSKFPYAAYS